MEEKLLVKRKADAPLNGVKPQKKGAKTIKNEEAKAVNLLSDLGRQHV